MKVSRPRASTNATVPRSGPISPSRQGRACSGRNTTDFALLAAGSVIVATPVVLVYVFLQRHFIRGMLAGAVKG